MMLQSAGTLPLRRERWLLLGLMLVLAAGAWAWLAWQSPMMGDASMGLTMGLGPVLFLLVWLVMMVAMMFPAAAPMILTFATITKRKRANAQAFVPTWIFVAAYLLIWTVAGGLAYGLALLADAVGGHIPWLMAHGARVTGGLILLAGVYQLTPLKARCLAACQTPLQFIMRSWRGGTVGALRMGLEHGLVCFGCCWLLFVLLFPLGVMNIAVMALLTAVIFAEKVFPLGRRLSLGLAFALIGYGLVVLMLPQTLIG